MRTASRRRARIAIAGSINTDLSFRTPHNPSPGETLTASTSTVSVGGKGANQAVACARLSHNRPLPYHHSDSRSRKRRRKGKSSHYSTTGSTSCRYNEDCRHAQILMVGMVGDDTYGEQAIKALTSNLVHTSYVEMADDEPTGTAVVLVDEGTGENRIVLNPGANRIWPVGYRRVPHELDVAVFQLEIPLEAVYTNLKIVSVNGTETIFNPAPAKPLQRDVYKYVNHLIMNESEACILSGRPVTELSPNECKTLCQSFIDLGVQNVVITLGAKGAAFMNTKTKFNTSSAHRVADVQDTTGAGDTFVGAYAVNVAHTIHSEATFSLSATVDFAMCAAALSVSKQGAMDSVPWAEEVAHFARSKGLLDDCWTWNSCLNEIFIPESDDGDDGGDNDGGDGDNDGNVDGGVDGSKKRKGRKPVATSNA